MPAQELGVLVQWEKSRLAHQVRRMQEQGLIVREANPADRRSAMICLLPAGRQAIENAAPRHVHNVRRHFIDLFTPAELDTFAALNERVLHHLAEESLPEEPTPRRARAPALSGLIGPRSRNPGSGHAARTGLLDAEVSAVTVAKAYRLLKAILNVAVDGGLIRRNPCRIKGAGQEKFAERPVLRCLRSTPWPTPPMSVTAS